MTDPSAHVWQPRADISERAHVTALMRRLDVGTFDEMHALSIAEPERYWRVVVDYLGIVWSHPYTRLMDTSEGIELPSWFVGGRLNWVETILSLAADPELSTRPAIVAENENGSAGAVTWGELPSLVRRVAHGLAQMGVCRGDRVGLLMETGVESLVTAMATAHLGAILVPLFSGFGTDAIISRLSACSARILVGTAGFQRRGRWVDVLSTLTTAAKDLPDLEKLVIKAPAGMRLPEGVPEWEVLASGPEAGSAETMSPDDPFLLIYTSGTTGKPKGAVHTHGGFPIRIAHDAAVHFNIGRGDVFCWPADMGWVAGMLVASAALMRGATLVCYDGAPDHPGRSRMGKLIERHRVTHYGASPTLIRGLAAHEKEALDADLSSIRLLVTAGEVIDPEHFVWFERHFGRGECPVINYTGGTEVSGALLASVVVKPIVPGGFNSASPGVAADVVDEHGSSVTGQIGELAVRAPFIGMTQAFWQDRERYLETYWRTLPGIWVHGDLALRDESGQFFLKGRSDDTLKVAGKRLGPAEVEDILMELPAVTEAAAIGVDDPVKGQKLVVFIVPTTGTNLSAAAAQELVVQHIETRLGRPFRPERVHVVSQLPKTRAGKIMRRLVRAVYQDRPTGDLTALANPEALDETRAARGSA